MKWQLHSYLRTMFISNSLPTISEWPYYIYYACIKFWDFRSIYIAKADLLTIHTYRQDSSANCSGGTMILRWLIRKLGPNIYFVRIIIWLLNHISYREKLNFNGIPGIHFTVPKTKSLWINETNRLLKYSYIYIYI